jgi:hypothetical protein
MQPAKALMLLTAWQLRCLGGQGDAHLSAPQEDLNHIRAS